MGDRQGHGSLRLPWLTLGLTGVIAAFFLAAGPLSEALLYDRAAIGQGEIWRLATGHLVHSDVDHLGWNLAALMILGGLVETTPGLGRAGLLVALGIGTVAVTATLWWAMPGLDRYCGLSGVLNAVYVVLLAGEWRRTEGPILLILLAANAVKIGVETVAGGALFTDPFWPPVPAAHLAGFVAGLAALPMIGHFRSAVSVSDRPPARESAGDSSPENPDKPGALETPIGILPTQ